ncbi:TonB-dependent receptor [Psychrosphaera saromensis]|uniref:Ligand-gated channel protein n=1 Tax=Psychrosphaera saromensis TaxID=716813 RepID=A0A2S7UXU1_9GAMM|nr:TonB-dependent receptor [Psychrosphaera saromensis]PQJ54558.1 ligand-gated channel protein [Psychrosphaera saromensis]GHB58962.1 TonB-dependent receptor [Psychrosphaera saromensis]GLQ14231.1 TonB-dependent receptor [Psychrosphaera saromensis]
MSNFKPNLVTIALITAGIASGAHAAEPTTKDAKELAAEATDNAVEVIEVTGFRKSLVKSISLKRYSGNVVEAISAEDIGKLPDSSIAESIARLPGLAAQRIDGRASKVSIRGFGENESGTTLNGREQVSIGDNRGVEFDLYPSEIMSGVTVYKTPNASLEGEGIAGVIDLQTIKPLSQDGRVIQVNGTYEKTSFDKLNPDGENDGVKGTFFYMDQFADDTLGVAFAYTTMSSPNQEKRWNAWGYPEFEYTDGTKGSILGGAKPYVRSSVLDRDSAMLVIEAAPTDNLKVTFDALYVDFLDTKILRGIEIPFAWGQGSISPDTAVIDEATGFVTSATTEGQRVVVRNDYEERDAQLMSFGFNTNWAVNDTWILDFDASYSKVERDVYSVESYSGTGRGDSRGVADNLGYTFDSGNTGATFTHELDYSDFNLIQLGGPLSWGGSSALNNQYNLSGTDYENQAQDGFINAPNIDDELMSLKFAASQEIDSNFISAISYGIAFREREKTKKSEGYYMTLSNFSYPNNAGMLSVPEEYRLGSANLDFIGMGNMVAYDTMGLINDGYYNLLQESLTDAKHATKSWVVNEQVTSAFVQAELATEIADMPITGGFGIRYVHTEQSSQGSAFNTVNGLVVAQATDASHDYGHFLPSINLSMQIDDTQTVRFGAAKTISRARLDEMNASYSASYNQQPDDSGNYWALYGGNPSLEPKEAIGIDVSYENYFSAEGYFAVALFHKDLQNWIFDGNYSVDMTGITDPETGLLPATTSGTGSGKVNGGDGTLSGYEISATLPFNIISEDLDGFGIIASYTGIESDMKDQNDNEYQLPGLSDSISSATIYYDHNGFSARASMRKRDAFKGDVYGLGFDTVQVDILGETVWDAQIGYDFGEAGFEELKGLSIFLQGYNLTKEPFTSLQGDNALQVRDYQDYGSTYLLGFSYKL